ncbi:MAG TPA: polyribonucleotide nucleotidyltransferase [Thermomicrobiales bacterium]|nr:polyribonucleotide nucleotidyltransferase [Thermomicrobiales bacterium]
MSTKTAGPVTKSLEIAGRTLTIEHGLLAEQASGAVTIRYGDTMLLVTVVGVREPKENAAFFPLSVDFEERMYAAGKIPGGFIKREGRPTENAILSARMTDRPIRPLFPKGYMSEVQVVSTILSADQENDPGILSIIGASTALSISPIPWEGPVGAARIGLVDGTLVVNPTFSDLENSKLDMIVAGTADAIVMVEGESGEISEEQLLEGMMLAHEEIKRICAFQQELVGEVGKDKWEYAAPVKDEALMDDVRGFLGNRLIDSVNNPDKVMRLEGTNELELELRQHFAVAPEGGEAKYTPAQISEAFDSLLKETVRSAILDSGTRPDGRKPTEIRPIWSMTGYLPRAHGSAIFTRGQTQVISVTTLGTASDEQRLDSISPIENKRYMHHYNFPPYSVGEARFMRGPSRRDIGHGALAERALLAVLPTEEEFPYAVRVVSDVVSSNGSSSMASVCGSTMSLMDAGVPIRKPVAGVAMGLVTDDSGRYTVLTDIQGLEDHLGDMDFKVAGTADGVTAVQMDIKVKGLTADILRQALSQAFEGRQFILGKMLETISEPRADISQFAPRITQIKINPDKIGLLIGPGGKNIRALQEETGAKIDIADDGTVSIASVDKKSTDDAIQRIKGMTDEIKIEVGEIYTGKIVGIQTYGAFVQLMPGKDGLVHISELSEDPSVRVNKVEDLFNLNDEITVMVTDVAPNGKVSLSRRAAITGEMPPPKTNDRGPRGGGDRGPRRDGGDRGPRRDGDRDRDRGPRHDGDRQPSQRAESDSEVGTRRESDRRDDGDKGRPAW